ncbi:hypothetical protein BDF14DRAFT_1882231 [Spinellus fusiger]|nr:hypothetical protein BDF14DRAFT_1882231 [Spinellus fusiger]
MANLKNPFHDVSGAMAESTLRIKELYEAEKKLVLLVETAGEALDVLSQDINSSDVEQAIRQHTMDFRTLASRYFSLINDIQLSLRNHTHYLAKTSSITPSTSKSIPFQQSTATEQRELEIWTSALSTLGQSVQTLLSIVHDQNE